jgi:hypothetical protein
MKPATVIARANNATNNATWQFNVILSPYNKKNTATFVQNGYHRHQRIADIGCTDNTRCCPVQLYRYTAIRRHVRQQPHAVRRRQKKRIALCRP